MEKLKNQYDADGKRHGFWEAFFFWNVISSRGYYINGLEEGRWEYYFRSGGISETVIYHKAFMVDLYQKFNADGSLYMERINIR